MAAEDSASSPYASSIRRRTCVTSPFGPLEYHTVHVLMHKVHDSAKRPP